MRCQRLRRTEDILTDLVSHGFYPYALERIPLINFNIRDGNLAGQAPSRFDRNYEVLLKDVRFENHVQQPLVVGRDYPGPHGNRARVGRRDHRI